MAELAGLILGIVGVSGAVDVCVKAGKHVSEKYDHAKNTDKELHELSTRIHLCSSLLEKLRAHTDTADNGMSDDEKRIHRHAVSIIESKLEDAVTILSKLQTHAHNKKSQKLRFGLRCSTLQQAVQELELWHQQFQPYVYSLVRRAPSHCGLDKSLEDLASPPKPDNDTQHPHDAPTNNPVHGEAFALRQRLDKSQVQVHRDALAFRRALDKGQLPMLLKTFSDYHISKIRYCTAVIGVNKPRPGRLASPRRIIDRLSIKTVSEKDAARLVYRLRSRKPISFGLLECLAFMRCSNPSDGGSSSSDDSFEDDADEIAMVFRIPDGFSQPVRSMRDLLLHTAPPNSLTMRLERARQLTRGVYYVHLHHFVHKNISAETVLVLGREQDDVFGSAVALTGFQLFRGTGSVTNTTGFGREGAARMYQHPERLALDASGSSVRYMPQHDMYSLGVCILEIGIWESLLAYPSEDLATPNEALGFEPTIAEQTWPEHCKDTLLKLCRGRLRQGMGDQYASVVENCLTCLDEGSTHFEDVEELYGNQAGEKYVEVMLEALDSILI